jgi:CzcA family heavy metal efflux pump
MQAIVAWSLRFRVLVAAIAAAIMVAGVTQLPRAPVDELPEFSPPYVEIQTEALGLSAEEVEQLITVPLEADLLNGVAWLDSIESASVTGLSSIVLTFEPGTDPIRARQMVAERLTQAHALPNVSKPPVMLQPLSSVNRLLMVSLASNELSAIEMSVLARWTIQPRLMGVPGVANVAIWGWRDRQLQVLVDPERLRDQGVSLDDVVETTGNALAVSPLTYLEASTPGTGGFIDTPNQRLAVQHIFPIDTADDLARVTIESDEPGTPLLRLGDVADVVEDHQLLIGDVMLSGSGVPGLLLVVEKFPEANTLEVTTGVEDAFAAMLPGLSGVQIDTTVFRPATYLVAATANFTLALVIGLVLVAAALSGLLFDWRAAVISLVAIVLSMIVAGLVLTGLGATVNLLVVAGIAMAIVIVVDDAVIGTTSALRRLREDGADGTEGSRSALVIRAALDVRGPMVYATLVLAVTVVPFLLIGDVTGALLPPLLAAYLVALLASVAVASIVTPALAHLLLSARPPRRREPRLVAFVEGRYRTALARVLGRPRPAFVTLGALATAVVVVFAVFMAPQVAGAGVPSLRERDLLIHWDGAPGTSHPEMSRIVAQASSELRLLPGVRNVGAHVGRAITSDQVVGMNSGEIWLGIEADADYDATLAAVQEVVDGYPGLRRDILTYPAERISQVIGGPVDDVVVRVFGQDLDVMRGKAQEVEALLSDIDGISAVAVEPSVVEPTIQVEVDLSAAERHGLKPGDVRRVAATLLSGIGVGSLFEEQKVFEVVVWGTPEMRHSLSSVKELLIETPDGSLVPLDDVADVRIGSLPTVIQRDAVQRRVDVGATVSGRDIGAVLADVERALATMQFPLETHAEILGNSTQRQAALATLLAVAAAALIGIFLLLQAAFVSWRLAVATFLSLPAALAGGVLVAFAIGVPGSLGAVMGLVAVLGIAVRNGVLLIEHYRQLELTEEERFGPDLVRRGASERLAPTLTTAVATAAILLPFAVLGTRAGFEIVHPMSLVILGGLVTSTLFSLFIVPSLFLRAGASPAQEAVAIPIEQTAEPQVIGAR